jgi:hypothetical protein
MSLGRSHGPELIALNAACKLLTGPVASSAMTIVWAVLVIATVVGVVVGGYFYNRGGPGEYVRDPNVKARRNNWVP